WSGTLRAATLTVPLAGPRWNPPWLPDTPAGLDEWQRWSGTLRAATLTVPLAGPRWNPPWLPDTPAGLD
ncbi:hypothetical protein ACLXBB_37330, partial [Pseudomonas aeruginosa]